MNKLMLVTFTAAFLMLNNSFSARSQASLSVEKDVTIELVRPNTGEILYTLSSGLERIVNTPSENFLRTVTFTIEADNPIMNFSGPRKILEVIMYCDIDGDGEDEVIADTMAVLTRSGNLKLVFHSNGAGNRLPPGWDF